MKGQGREKLAHLFAGLTFRVTAPMVMVFLVVLGITHSYIYFAVMPIVKDGILREMERVGKDIYEILDDQSRIIYSTSGGNRERLFRLYKGKSLGILENYFQKNDLYARIISKDGDVLLASGLEPGEPAPAHRKTQAKNIFQGRLKGDTRYFYRLEYKPWEWVLIFTTGEDIFGNASRRIFGLFWAGSAVLIVLFAMFLSYANLKVHRIKNSIILPLRNEEPPDYQGIREFEVISDTIRSMMRTIEDKNYLISSLVGMAGVLILAADGEGRIILVNHAFQDLASLREDNMIGEIYWRRFFDKAHGNVAEKSFRELLDSGEAKQFVAPMGNDGDIGRSILWNHSLIRDAHGKPKYIFLTGVDITEQVLIHKALNESETKYRTLINNSGEAILVLQDGEFKFSNLAMERFTGLSGAELRDQALRDILHPADRETVAEGVRKISIGGGPAEIFSCRIIDKKGGTRWFMVNCLPFHWDGQPAALIFARDTTKVLDLERQVQQSRRIETITILAGGVAHDFNNLLGAIIGNASLIKNAAGNGTPIYNQADRIEKTVERAALLTKKLIDFARPKHSQKESGVDLNLSVTKFLENWDDPEPTDIRVSARLGPDLPPVRGDEYTITEIIRNICENAAEAMAGGGEIVVSTSLEMVEVNTASPASDIEPCEYVVLSVVDEGYGMESEVAERVFEPYFTTKSIEEGAGLGLSQVYGLIKELEGDILINSETGRGTVVKVFMKPATFTAGGNRTDNRGLPDTPVADM